MKTLAAAMAMMAVLAAGALYGQEENEQTVKVYVDHGEANLTDVSRAKAQVEKMFQPAGVRVQWMTDSRSAQRDPNAIVIRLVSGEPAGFSRTALAAALAYEGKTIEVAYDRVKANPVSLQNTLLAHVMVHEMTHLLERIARHSDAGIMKATWGPEDYHAMRTKPLTFASEDITLIHLGLEQRAASERSTLLAKNTLHAVN